MVQWEYKWSRPYTTDMNNLGVGGWEAFAVQRLDDSDELPVLMKRPIPHTPARPATEELEAGNVTRVGNLFEAAKRVSAAIPVPDNRLSVEAAFAINALNRALKAFPGAPL